jgi:hypothetical protein
MEPESKTQEIEELLSFAEKVSEHITSLEAHYQKAKFQFMIYFMVAYFGVVAIPLIFIDGLDFANLQKVVTSSSILIAAVGFVFMARSRRNLARSFKRSLSVEFRVLEKLIQMLTSLLESVPSSTPIVARGLLEMRMMRIKFSNEEIERSLRKDALNRRRL